jgi:type IV pilus modification protein PilV
MKICSVKFKGDRKKSAGFSLIEVMFAIVILGVGLLALMAMFANAVAVMQFAQEDQIAKQKAREAMEGVYAARNDTSITFDNIQNISNGGIFKDGFQNMYLAGANGIVGTAQDTTTLDRVILPGPNGLVETAPTAATPAGDDILVPLVNYQRQILIGQVLNADSSVKGDLRKITVTVRVTSAGRGTRDYAQIGYISQYQ